MAIKNTVFQALDKAINGNWQTQASPHVNNYDMSSIGDKIIYKTTDKADYEQKKLELKQDAYLKDRWVRANVNLSVAAYAGLGRIQLMYRDADFMDSMPEIGAALDIVSEESVLPHPIDGSIVNVYSKSDRVKRILEDLFVNRLNIQLTGQMVIRAMCKYGNQFMLLDVDHKNGVKSWKQLPVAQVERIENGIRNPYGAGVVVGQGKDVDRSTQFIWTDEATSTQAPFRDWQIAHFRLINNSMYLPYGCLVGDTRIETETGYKEMSNIQIGDKVWTFNTETQERELGEVTMFMPKGEKDVYRVSTKHNYIVGTKDHKILCYDGDNFIYKEISDIKIDDLIVIRNGIKESCILPKIDKTPLPSSRNRGIKWFDDNIGFIPDYVDEELAEFLGFMIGDGSITYGRIITIAGGIQETFNRKYEKILQKYSTAKVSRRYRNDGSLLSIVTSSKFLAEVLYRLGYIDGFNNKRIPSWVFEAPISIKKAFLTGIINADGYMFIDNRRPNSSIRCDIELENEQLVTDIKILVQSLGYKSGQIFSRVRKPHFSQKIGRLMAHSNPSYFLSFYEVQNSQEKVNDLNNRLCDGFKLEKVRKIEYVGKKQTYDFTVNNDNSNFFANGIVTHNCSYLNPARRSWRMLSLMEDAMFLYRLERSMERRVYKIYVGAIDDADVPAYVERVANEFKRTPIIDPQTGQVDLRKNVLSVQDDIFVPVRDVNAPNPIDTLAAGQNMTALDDIKYVQNKICAALRIPKSFLNFEEAAGDGKNLALMDIRFTRTINRIQQAFLMELTKIATIHLFLLGFDDELTNFTLSMNNPSTQAEQLEIENLQKKISAVRDAVSDPGTGIPPMSLVRALKTIMKWSEKDIKENFEEIRLEKGLAAELEKTTQIIKKTGIFDSVDRIYGEPGAEYMDDQQGGQGGMDGGPGGGGGPMGGGPTDFGSELDSMGDVGADDTGDIAGNEGAMPMGDMDAGTEAAAQPMESSDKKGNLIMDDLMKKYLNTLKEEKVKGNLIKRAEPHDLDGFFINEEIDNLRASLQEFVKENEEKVG